MLMKISAKDMASAFADKLKRWIFGPNGGEPTVAAQRALRAIYAAQARLINQLKAHAARAPYEHVAAKLREVAEQKKRSLETLRERARSLGPWSEPEVGEAKSGRNHWERMAVDLKDQSDFVSELRSAVVQLADETPDLAELLSGLAQAEAAHKELLLDLLMRADPQAGLTS
jgi:hypothetical protein